MLRDGRVDEGGSVCRSVAETGDPCFEEEGNHAHEFADEHAGAENESCCVARNAGTYFRLCQTWSASPTIRGSEQVHAGDAAEQRD